MKSQVKEIKKGNTRAIQHEVNQFNKVVLRMLVVLQTALGLKTVAKQPVQFSVQALSSY